MLSGHSARPTVTALVTTLNEEENIAACLETLGWCDEILVVDSFSTDRTREIACRYPKVRFVERTYHGSASQKNWAMDRIHSEWILILDSDERCTPELRDEIIELLASGPEHDAYTLARRVFFLGQVIRYSGWQRDRVVRLVRRGAGRYPNRRVHADMVTASEAPVLEHRLDHYMVTDIAEYARRTTKYSWWGASQVWREGGASGPTTIVGRSLWRFLRTYVVQGGFLDGTRGLVFCLLQAYGTFLKWGIVWSWRAGLADAALRPKLPTFDHDTATWRGLDRLGQPLTPATEAGATEKVAVDPISAPAPVSVPMGRRAFRR